jgi:hypothetical protein
MRAEPVLAGHAKTNEVWRLACCTPFQPLPLVEQLVTKEEAMDTMLNQIQNLQIDPLSDEVLEIVAGGKSSDSLGCCSCAYCSDNPPPDNSGL